MDNKGEESYNSNRVIIPFLVTASPFPAFLPALALAVPAFLAVTAPTPPNISGEGSA